MDQLFHHFKVPEDIIIQIAGWLDYDDIVNNRIFDIIRKSYSYWETKALKDFTITEVEFYNIMRHYKTDANNAYLIVAAQRKTPYPGVEMYICPSYLNMRLVNDYGILRYFYHRTDTDRKAMIYSLLDGGQISLLEKLFSEYQIDDNVVIDVLGTVAEHEDITTMQRWLDKYPLLIDKTQKKYLVEVAASRGRL